MPRIVFFIVFLGLFCLGLGHSSAKASDSAYFVKAVQVDVLDQSAVKARNKAFIEAQKQAFMILASRFKSPEEMIVFKSPADSIIAGLIQDFEISSEQASTKRYKGKFDFRFKSGAVNQYFGHGVKYYDGPSGDESQTILIIPYYHEGTNPPVWDISKNPYFASLKADLLADKTIILPKGDISDKTDIGDVAPNKLSYKSIRKLKARYEVNTIFVAVAHVDLRSPKFVKIDIFRTDKGSVELVKSFESSPASVAKETFLAVHQPLNTGGFVGNAPQPLQAEEELSENAVVPENSDFSNDAAPSVPKGLQDRYIATTDKVKVSGQVVVKIFFTSFPEWINIQKKIRQMGAVQDLRILSLKSNQVDATLVYKDWSELLSAMAASGFSLQNQSGNTYILKRSSIQ